jgi:hypothetical protein
MKLCLWHLADILRPLRMPALEHKADIPSASLQLHRESREKEFPGLRDRHLARMRN